MSVRVGPALFSITLVGVALLGTACSGQQLPVEESEGLLAPTPESTNATSPQSEQSSSTDRAKLPQLDNDTFVQDENQYLINPLIPRDGIRPIYNPEFATAEEATYFEDELVIGVEINGEAKAYPITLLNSREMVNDELGGTPILITW